MFPPVFPQSLGSCPDTQVMTLASSPPSSRCLPCRVCQTLRFLSSQFCRMERSVFRQQFHSCPCTRIMTLVSSPPSARCPPFGTSVAFISFPSLDLRVCQTLNSHHPPRLLEIRVCPKNPISQFCRTDRSMFRQQLHSVDVQGCQALDFPCPSTFP